MERPANRRRTRPCVSCPACTAAAITIATQAADNPVGASSPLDGQSAVMPTGPRQASGSPRSLDGQLPRQHQGLMPRFNRRKCLSTVSEGPHPGRQRRRTRSDVQNRRRPHNRPISASISASISSPHLRHLHNARAAQRPWRPGPHGARALLSTVRRSNRLRPSGGKSTSPSRRSAGSGSRRDHARVQTTQVPLDGQPGTRLQRGQGQGKEKTPGSKAKGSEHQGLMCGQRAQGPIGLRSGRRTPRSAAAD